MARLENRTYEEIVAHLKKELELNALEESDDLPISTMASSSGKARNLLSNGINTNKDNQCSYCKAEDHFWKKEKCWRGAGAHLRPKGIDRTLKIQSPPKTKTPSLKSKNLQHLHQANRTQRNLTQKTNFATSPNI